MGRMLNEKVKGGSLEYTVSEGQVCVVSCHVQEGRFEIPDFIEGMPVVQIGKKALLGSKILRELVLPGGIKEVGDWAFAHCDKLSEILMPEREIRFGKGVFKGCGCLRYMKLKENEDLKLAGLLAAVPVMLEADYLLSLTEAGERFWLQKLDARLKTLLEKPDKEGYSKQVLCGEEDLMASLELYLNERRKQKARLCYMRLLNDTGLADELKEQLEKYIKENTKGCEFEASWEVVLKEHGNEQEYYSIFARAGGITEENFDELLLDMGENYPEMKAWLIRYKEENSPEEDFFAGLSLD